MKNDNSKRTQQLMAFMQLAQEKKDKGTMKDMAEKAEKLSTADESQLTSAQKRGRLITKNLMQAYDPNAVVVWHSLFMPTEIFYAMDIVPFSTEMISAGIAGAGLSKGFVESAEEFTLCRDSCSFSTCTIGAILKDVFPTPDFLVTTSQLCDPEKKLGRFAAEEYGRKDFFIDIPYGGCLMKEDELKYAVDYVAHQLENMVDFIERETGRKLDGDKLSQALQYSNEAREWYLKVDELRKNNPPLISGVKILDFSTVLLNIWGTKESADIFKSLYEEVSKVAEQGGLPNEKYRIGWIHLRPYYDNTIINYLEKECGVYIIKEEINQIFWDEHDLKDPFRSIARKLLKNPAYSPMEVRIDIYRKVIKDYRFDGLIGFTQKGCRHFYSSIHIAAEALKNECIWLVIDGDCVDPRAYSFPLIKTRVDSFVDMMEMKKNR
ncbi:MAG: 2-hydroxyacyl-CoA dehydratase [Syntrophaceae bacterium]|nr:2-hydroxyacyl-CoA dehydratase [Syntrophaceae bacterium]